MINLNDLRKAQLIMLDMLVEFDKICKEHNLRYWLDSGTLLGAVRHKGFIPWDDDIDISMPIEDYKKFLKVAKLPSDIFLQTKQSDREFKFDYAKLRSKKATIIEFHEKDKKVNYNQGVFVDIFPMLTINKSDENIKLYQETFKELRANSAISLHTPNGVDNPKKREALIKRLEALHQGWDRDDTIIIYSGQMPDLAAWFDYKEVFPLKEIEFEGLKFLAPKNPHHYLSQIYSFDYMQLPPEEKRKIHAFKIEFN